MKPAHGAIIISVLLSINLSVKAQSLNGIERAIVTNDVPLIEKELNGDVEITIANNSGEYSESQGAIVLKNFLSTHHPKKIVAAFQGTSPQGSSYLIGNLITSIGEFRMYIYAKKVNGTLVMKEIRFDNM